MLYGDLTARENLAFFASLYGLEEPEADARIDELLRLVELDHRANDCARTFSRGMQQRLSIARALINDPELVLLDEPYSGLDPHAAELFDRLISRGMQQRLSIARALINDPELVLLDEPYSGLDPHAAELFDRLIARVRDGRTFVMVSHDLEKGFDLCTHALIMARGRAVVCAETAKIDRAAFRDLYLATVGMGVA